MSSTTFKYCCVLFLFAVQFQSAVEGQCNDTGTANIRVTNIQNEINFHLPDKDNLTNREATITYTWDVQMPENEVLDGFIYCFHDIDKRTIDNIKGAFGSGDLIDANDTDSDIFDPFPFEDEDDSNSSLPSIPYSELFGSDDFENGPEFGSVQSRYIGCENYFGKKFWATDGNGTYGECSYPCTDEINQDCVTAFPIVCSYLSQGCLPLPRYQRNLTLPINFGRLYQLYLYPYVRQESGIMEGNVSPALFCAHHHIEELNLTQDVIYDYCRTEQTLASVSLATGPPSRLKIHRIHRNFDDNTFMVTIKWGRPHDIVPGANITSYIVSAANATTPTVKLSLADLEDFARNSNYHYNLTYNGLHQLQNITISVRASVIRDPSTCILRCQNTGNPGTVFAELESFEPCSNDTGISYCHEKAICEVFNDTKIVLANCTCMVGYVGNGYNPEVLSDGTGCYNFNACDSKPRTCSQYADCLDAAPPSLDVLSCICGPSFVGDGYLSGNGCIHIGVIAFLVLILIIAIICIIIFALRFRRRFKNKRLLSTTLSKFVSGNTGNFAPSLTILNVFHPTSQEPEKIEPVFGAKYELERSDVVFQEIIGRGNFGVVHKAILNSGDGEKTVAVKSLTGVYATNYRDDFLAEIFLLITLGNHENILSVEGVCTVPSNSDDLSSFSPLLITEYMIYGDLLHFLWDSRDASMRERDPVYDFTEISLYKIGRQAAHGLDYLADARIIHGDVAARNILVGENLKIKISDFGLANDVYRYGVIKGATERRVPFKWISPERMNGGKDPITWKSDVWSFGILLYEMVTLGAAPYPGMTPATIYHKLQSGYRIPQPSSCSDYLYKIIMNCWSWKPYNRPTFKELEKKLFDCLNLENNDHRIEVLDEVNETNYELEIGKRDSNSELKRVDENGSLPQNGSVCSSETDVLTVSSISIDSHTPNGLSNGNTVPWQPWSGDIPVTGSEQANPSNGLELGLLNDAV